MTVTVEVDTSGVIRKEIAEDSSWAKCLGELIDNSFDAGASVVRIVIDGKSRDWRLTVEDDGRGCEDIIGMFKLGKSTKGDGRHTLGTYGVGLKHASMWLCQWDGYTEVVTSSAGKCQSMGINWGRDLNRNGDGKIGLDDPVDVSEAYAGRFRLGTGTIVAFRGIDRQMNRDHFKKLVKAIASTYAPALRSGKAINIAFGVDNVRLLPPDSPLCVEILPPTTISVAGRKAVVTGMLRDAADKSGRTGLNYSFGGSRVLMPDSPYGFGDYTPGGLVVGEVELSHGWQLSPTKTSVTDRHFDELQERIEEYLRPLLEKAQSANDVMRCDALHSMAMECLGQRVGGGQRGRGTRNVTTRDPNGEGQEPTGAGSKHEEYAEVDSSKGDEHAARDRVKGFERGRGGKKKAKGGSILAEAIRKPGDQRMAWLNGDRVQYNACHPALEKIRAETDVNVLRALFLALVVGSTWCESEAAEDYPLFKDQDWQNRVGLMFKSPPTMERKVGSGAA